MYWREMRIHEYEYSEEYWDTWLCSKCDPNQPLRTIIAGSREGASYGDVKIACALANWKIGLVLSGRARGVDQLGEKWAMERDLIIEPYPANWDFGKGAGHMRNQVMASRADALVAVWDGVSKGTKHMIETAEKFNLQTIIYNFVDGTHILRNPPLQTTMYSLETIPKDGFETTKIKKQKK